MDGVLTRPDGLLLSEEDAIKLFGTTDVVGKSIGLKDRHSNVTKALTVGAVLKRADVPSHIVEGFSFASSKSALADFYFGPANTDIASQKIYSYVLLQDGSDPRAVQKRLRRFIFSQLPGGHKAEPTEQTFQTGSYLRAVADIHLNAKGFGQLSPGGDKALLAMIGLVATFIFSVSAVNFLIIQISLMGYRAREVAVRRVAGASSGDIIVQFLIEAALQVIVALAIALALADVFLVQAANYLSLSIKSPTWNAPIILLGISGLFFVLVVIGGAYPAYVMSRVHPNLLLNQGDFVQKARAQAFFVGVEVFIASFLIATTIVFASQASFLRNQDRGVVLDHVATANMALVDPNRHSAFLIEAENIPGVIGVTHSDKTVPLKQYTPIKLSRDEPSADQVDATIIGVSADFADIFSIEVAAGRWLDAETDYTDSETTAIVASKSLLRAMGLAADDIAIGATVIVRTGRRAARHRIVGIVDDIKWRSLRSPQGLLAYRIAPRSDVAGAYFKLTADKASQAKAMTRLASLAKSMERIAGFSAKPRMLQQEFEDLNADNERQTQIFLLFAVLVTSIAAIGIYGVTLFYLQRRRKEIAIRRTFGASEVQVLKLLLRRFLVPVGLAATAAMPLAFLYSNHWIEEFVDRIPLTPLPFAAAVVIAVSIALLTIQTLVRRAVRLHPVDSLYTE